MHREVLLGLRPFLLMGLMYSSCRAWQNYLSALGYELTIYCSLFFHLQLYMYCAVYLEVSWVSFLRFNLGRWVSWVGAQVGKHRFVFGRLALILGVSHS